MNQTEQSSTDQFTEFSASPVVKNAPRSIQGNILKDVNYQRHELNQLQPSSRRTSVNEPKVIVKRSGDFIESIEFICSCGCTKTVSFNYEGE